MARCGIDARIIDKRDTKVFVGHADGLRPRTLELFDSMGFQHRVLHEADNSTEVNLWVCMPSMSQIGTSLTRSPLQRALGTRESQSDKLLSI